MKLARIFGGSAFRRTWLTVSVAFGLVALLSGAIESARGNFWIGAVGFVSGLGLFWVAYTGSLAFKPKRLHT